MAQPLQMLILSKGNVWHCRFLTELGEPRTIANDPGRFTYHLPLEQPDRFDVLERITLGDFAYTVVRVLNLRAIDSPNTIKQVALEGDQLWLTVIPGSFDDERLEQIIIQAIGAHRTYTLARTIDRSGVKT